MYLLQISALVDMTRGDWTVEDWGEMSRRGKVCAVFGCRNTPSKCPDCNFHYCPQDIRNHVHIMGEDVRVQDKRDESLR